MGLSAKEQLSIKKRESVKRKEITDKACQDQ